MYNAVLIYLCLAIRLVFKKSKNKIFIIQYCNEWWGHLRGSAPGQPSFEEMSQQCRSVGDNEPDLTGQEIEPQLSRAYRGVFNRNANRSVQISFISTHVHKIL